MEEILNQMQMLVGGKPDEVHPDADALLIKLIKELARDLSQEFGGSGNISTVDEIIRAYEEIEKWYE